MANEKISLLTETTFKIPNMVCEGCGEKITSIFKDVAGVKKVIAKAFQKQIHVSYYAEQIKQEELKKILENGGFNAVEL